MLRGARNEFKSLNAKVVEGRHDKWALIKRENWNKRKACELGNWGKVLRRRKCISRGRIESNKVCGEIGIKES